MTRKSSSVEGETKGRLATQREIRKRFGDKMLNAAYRRLCSKCASAGECLLIPLTTRGKDCPYFKEVKNATDNSNPS